MEKYTYRITEEFEGRRMDAVLSELIADLSRSHIQGLFDIGAVSINGEQTDSKKYKARAGDVVDVTVPEPETLKIEAHDIPLNIVFEDNDVLVIDKPVGMVVHPAIGNHDGTVVNAVMYHCGDSLSSINGVIRPGIVHRIDKDTSGLLIIAKNDKSHISLSRQLYEHSIVRKYCALVQDNLKEDFGTVDEPIGRDPKNRLKRRVGGINAKSAVTHYRVMERFGEYTFIECRLETGRTHQIRVHMAYIKHPLVGDPLYGSRKQDFNVTGQLLHAGVIGFIHPASGEYMEFHSDVREEFADVLNRLRG
ncbi:RNA pseudouridine synthase [Eubacterium minutum ATCC 700079]|nr:RNA pseudouridine synthase [Eubacterium minutum ATCC 700079]